MLMHVPAAWQCMLMHAAGPRAAVAAAHLKGAAQAPWGRAARAAATACCVMAQPKAVACGPKGPCHGNSGASVASIA